MDAVRPQRSGIQESQIRISSCNLLRIVIINHLNRFVCCLLESSIRIISIPIHRSDISVCLTYHNITDQVAQIRFRRTNRRKDPIQRYTQSAQHFIHFLSDDSYNFDTIININAIDSNMNAPSIQTGSFTCELLQLLLQILIFVKFGSDVDETALDRYSTIHVKFHHYVRKLAEVCPTFNYPSIFNLKKRKRKRKGIQLNYYVKYFSKNINLIMVIKRTCMNSETWS